MVNAPEFNDDDLFSDRYAFDSDNPEAGDDAWMANGIIPDDQLDQDDALDIALDLGIIG